MLWALGAQAQQTEAELMQKMKFRNIGPAGMSGRITSIAVVHRQPQTMYIGAASGGVWKSDNGGIKWNPVFDAMDVGSIGALAIYQANPAVVWAGTGEGNPRNSQNSGKGIYKSMDAGRTWKFMGLKETRTIHRIITDPINPDVVYAAAMGSAWGPGEERGVYKTTDGGQTWTRILFTNPLSGCAELVMDPTNPNKLFAAMWEYQRKPWFFQSGGKGSGLYMTTDGGKNWKKLGPENGLPEGLLGRIGISVAPSKPDKVYAIVESKTLDFYASTDGGYSWSKVSSQENMGNRPFYYNEIYSDPKNENRIYSLWSQVAKSEDGGRTWQILADWGHIHPDHHAFYIHPENPDFLINGNDGGLNLSYDGGNTWRFAENLPLGQFYHVQVDEDMPYHVYGGLQDNGSWRGPGYTWYHGGIRNSDWQELLFGDGFDVVPVPGNSNEGYAMWQGGNVYRYNLTTQTSEAIRPTHPAGIYLRFNWNAAIAQNPFRQYGLYYGSQFVHRSRDGGKSWEIISPDLTTNDTAKLHQEKSGGLTTDATNAENHCTIIAITPAPSDSLVLWVGTDDGNLQLTRNGGKTWTLLSDKIPGMPKKAWIPSIWVSPVNAGEAWVVVNNYRQNDWEPYLFKTTDFGATWKRMADGSKVSGHCLSVIPDSKQPNLVFLGTDHGLFVSFNAGNTWKKWTGFPSCPVQDMKIQERESDLVIATFGRSIWILDDIEPLRTAAGGWTTDKTDFKILHATDGVLANYMQAPGARFGADAAYEGPNKPFGSMLSLFVKGNKNTKSGKWEKTTCTGRVYNTAGQVVRTHKFSFDSGGFYRIQYRLISDGFRYPSHGTPDKESSMPEGMRVPPGRYKLVIECGKQKDSAQIEVKLPPGITWDAAGWNRKQALYNRLKTAAGKAEKSFEGLKEAEKTLDMVTNARYADDSANTRLKKLAEPLRDSLKTLKWLYMLPADFRGYEDVSVHLMNWLADAAGLIESSAAPSGNAETAVSLAEAETTKTIARVNAFFAGPWLKWKEAVEKEKMKPFKDLGGY
ncbi:MAG: hypothetical protein JNL57_10510 [Bacteroidetes bacterium]|nr:hypothetical protein [Bacteroidota bacterium]